MTPRHLMTPLVIAISILGASSSSTIDCTIEDFEDGSLGSFSGECLVSPGKRFFEVLKYDETFSKPDDDSNEYYASSAEGSPSCIRYSQELTVSEDSRIVLKVFKSGEAAVRGKCYAFAIDASSSGAPVMLDHKIIEVFGNGEWSMETVQFDRVEVDEIIWLEIVCDDLKQNEAFFAIDSIEIGSNNPEECKQTTTTTPETTTITTTITTLETTETTSDTTVTTEETTVTTTDTTVTTTDTTVTTEDTTVTTEDTTVTTEDTTVTTTDTTVTTADTTITTSETTTSTGNTESSSVTGSTTTLKIPITTPKVPNEILFKSISTIAICVASACCVWVCALSIMICCLPVRTGINRVELVDNNLDSKIPRLHVQKSQVNEFGEIVIDISGDMNRY